MLFLLYRLFQTKKIFYLSDDAISITPARFGEETRAGGGVVFNLKWRRYCTNDLIPETTCTIVPINLRGSLLYLFY